MTKTMITGLLLFANLIPALAQETRNELLEDGALALYVSFDEGAAAEVNRGGGAQGAVMGEAEYVEGVVGRALSFRSGEPKMATVTFGVKEAMTVEKGTLMFWFRPGWDGSDDQGRYTLAWVTMEGSERYFAMHRSFAPDDPLMLFANFHWDNVLQMPTRGALLADHWVHLAVTWNEEAGQYALYRNGALVKEATWKPLPKEGEYRPLTLRLGNFYKNDAPINADYDELFLFQRALSPAEIHAYVEETNRGATTH